MFNEYNGFNITAPYKIGAYRLSYELSDIARLTNSVNTLSLDNHKIIGHNTDAFGFEKGLAEFMPLTQAIIIGTGGVARSVAYSLIKNNFKNITFLYRRLESVKNIDLVVQNLKSYFKSQVQISYVAFESFLLANFDGLIINASSIAKNDRVFLQCLESIFSQNNKVKFYDLNYSSDLKPLPSQSICYKHNIKNINGLTMLIYQAKLAFEVWTKSKINLNSQNLKSLLEYMSIGL